ncbi:hypothetical protein V6Z11_A10G235000 [Gossypium hirsutum]
MNFIAVDLTFVAFSGKIDAVTFHCQPIITESHDLSSHIETIGMRSANSLMDLFKYFSGFNIIHTSQKHLILSSFIQDIPIKNKSRCHSSNCSFIVLIRLFGIPLILDIF